MDTRKIVSSLLCKSASQLYCSYIGYDVGALPGEFRASGRSWLRVASCARHRQQTLRQGDAGIHHVEVAAGAQLIHDAASAVQVTDDVASFRRCAETRCDPEAKLEAKSTGLG